MGPKDKYLGLPSVHGRKKGDFFGFLLEKVLQKLQGWKQNVLSQAGREVLIKSVIQAIPTYAMQCYLLPKGTSVSLRFKRFVDIYFTSVDSPPHYSSQVKINCDATFKDSNIALAIVARDSTGSLIYVDGMPCSSMSPLHAEVLAVHYACQLPFRRGWSQAIVESDCETTITLSSTETIPPSNLAALVSDIRS
ncbi:protein SCAI [Tanacetum coccineum]